MIGRKAMVGMLFFLAVPLANAGWSVGVSFAAPYHRHCYGPPPCYYRPYAPIYVRPAPVYVQPVTVLEPVPAVYAAPAPVLAPAPAATIAPVRPSVVARPVGGTREEDIERYQQQLQSPEARERIEAVMQLGRLRAPGSERTLVAALNNDRSPQVRDAAAKALGLVGASETLESLQRAASADEDAGVRNSAAYSAEVIRASYNRR